MQKKLLLSLVCTVPAALPALANVALTVPEANAWENPAIGEGNVTVNGTTVTCKVGVGSVSQEVKGLPAGKYKISFANLNNAAYTVAGATVDEDGVFELAASGDITITISAVNASLEFGFTGGQLTFVEDFSKKGEEFTAALAEAYKDFVELKDPKADAKLVAEQKVITDEHTALNALITTLGEKDTNAGQAVSVQALVDYYAKANATSFADLFTKIENRIAALQTKVEAFKPKAEAANEAYDIATTNTDNLKSLNNSIEWLLNNTTGSADSSKGVNVLIAALNDKDTNKDVKEANLPGAEAALEAIKALQADVEAAFKDATELVDITGFKETIATIKADLNEKWAKYENDVVAVTIFKDIEKVYADLKPQNAYLNAVANIGAIIDSENYGGTDVYASNKTTWLTDLQTINNTITQPKTFEEVDASMGVSGYETKIQNAIAEMNQVVADAQSFAEAQNAAYNAGYELYAKKDTGWDAVMKGYEARVNAAMPAALTEQYKELLATATEAIDAFKAYLDKTYSETALPGESYDADVKAVNDALDAIKVFLDGDYGIVTGLQADLNKIKAENAESFKTLNGTKYPEYAVPTNKFDAQYAAVQAAIDKIIADMNEAEDLKADANSVQETAAAITSLENGSKAFFEAFTATHDELVKALDNLAAFKAVIDAKYCAETGETFQSAKVKAYTDLETAFTKKDGFRDLYLAAAAAVGNASLEKAEALAKDLQGKAADIVAAQNKWNNEATQANLDFATDRLAELQGFMADHENLKTSVKFKEISDALGKVVVPADGNTADCTKADKAVKTQMGKMDKLYQSVQRYLSVTKILDEITNKETGAAVLATEANKNINGSAKATVDFYQAEIDALANVKAIQETIDKAFNSPEGLDEPTAKAQADAAQQKLNSLEGMEAKMQANWTAYSNQISDSGITRDHVQAILDNVKEAEYQGIVEDWVEQLEALLNDSLIANDVKATENYGKGNSVAANTEITNAYKAIRDAADDIAKEYTDGYDAAIIDQNNAITADFSPWAAVNKQLNDGYLDAVSLYNFYKNELTTLAGYREWMLDAKYNLVANYAEVYDVLPAIQSLNAQISALISKANAAKEYLPESEQYKAEYEQLVADQAAELAKLQALYNGLNTDANTAAQQYYDAKVKEYTDGISASIATLETAGLTSEEAVAGLKGISDILAAAEDYINDDKQTLPLGKAMNNVAKDKFAGIDFTVAITAAVDAKWAAEYDLNFNGRPGKDATETEPAVEAIPSVAELRDVMIANGAVKADIDKFDDVRDKMIDLDKTANTVDEKNPLINNLKKYIAELEGYRAALEQMVKAAQDSQKYKEIYDGYMGQVSDLQELVDNLNEYIAGYTLDAPVSVTPDPEDLLKALKENLGDKPSEAIAGETFKSEFEQASEEIMQALEAKKIAADEAGLATLKTWIDNTKVAYNTAVANGAAIADLAEEYKTIEDVTAWYEEYAGRGDKGFAVDFPVLVTEQLETILDTYKKLNPEGAASDLAAIQQDLADQKANIEKQIDEAVSALDELVPEDDPDHDALVAAVHDKLDPEFGALKSELENIKDNWEAEGDKLLVNSYEYEDAMDAVEGKIDGISDKGDDTLAAARKSLYNQQASEALMAEWTKLDEFYKQVRATVKGYELDMMYGRQLGLIDSMLAKLKATIAAEAAAENLTKASTINDAVYKTFTGKDINDAIETVAIEAAYTQTLYLQEEADKALTETYESLVGKYLIDGYSLKWSWRDYNNTYWNAYYNFTENYSYNGGSFKLIYSKLPQYEEFMKTFQSVIDAMQQIDEKAAGAEYTPGVVVDREATKVSAQDVMKLVDWVGNGVKYAELYDNEATRWQAVAADIDNHGDLNIADINLDIQLMLGKSGVVNNDNRFGYYSKPAAVVNDAACSIAYLGEVDGNDRYAVVVNNPTAFIGGQLDIKLPVGMSLVGVSATERTQGHEVMSFEHDAYTTRVLIFNMENEAIAGDNGAMLYIDVQGHGSFSLDEVLFTDGEYHLHGFGNPGTSGIIDAIIDGAGVAKEAIYDAAGRMYDRVQRGINIIRHSDGSVTKELRK